MQCNFKGKSIYPDGTFLYSSCYNKADILTTDDPCYGLCYACAYEKMKAKNKQLKKREKNCVGIEQENNRLKKTIQHIFDEINEKYSDKNVYTCEEELSSVLYLISSIYNVVAQILK